MLTSALDRWDGEAVARCSRAARERAGDLRALARALTRQGETSGWAGAAACASEDVLSRLRAEVVAAAGELDLLAGAWSAAGEGLELARALLARARDVASGSCLVVGPDGRVVAPLPAPEEDQARSSAADAAQALAWQALAAAEEVDRDAAAATAAVRWLPGGLLGLLAGTALLSGVATRGLPPPGLAPAEVAAWWDSLTAAERQDLERVRPEEVGGLDGVPVDVRDRANRALLAQALLALPRHDLLALVQRLGVIGAVREALDRPDARLLALDLDGDGRAVVALGDVETAEHVAVLVPGLNAFVADALGGQVSAAAALRERARSKRAGTVATVAWIGYQAPGVRQVVSGARAERGTPALRSFLRGIDARSAVQGRDVHLTLSGHSYGSLVAGYAVRERTGTDELVALGSPGVGVGRVDELWVRGEHVFVAEAGTDPVADLSRFGADPSSGGFGAREMQTDGRSDPHQERLRGIGWHTHYYEQGTESLDNLALVAVGRPDLVSYD